MQNNLSDERTEYLINDSLSFIRFLGPALPDRVPDTRIIRLFRERPTQIIAIERLFDRFDTASHGWADTAYRSKGNEDRANQCRL